MEKLLKRLTADWTICLTGRLLKILADLVGRLPVATGTGPFVV